MNIEISNVIKISKEDVESDLRLLNYISTELIIDNPVYLKNEKYGYSNYYPQKVPEKLNFYTKDNKNYYLPFGTINFILDNYKDSNIIYNFHKFHGTNIKSNIKPYSYQEKAINEALKKRNGIIIAPPGSGKTQIALELISRHNLKTLWITHTKDLLEQSYERAENNLENVSLSKIMEGKIENINADINFASVKTLSNLDNNSKIDLKLKDLRNEFDLIIVDECHRVCGTPKQAGMFYKVINELNTPFKIGLTATPYRSAKGTEKAMFGLLGEPIIEISEKEIEEKTIKSIVYKLETPYSNNLESYVFHNQKGNIDFNKVLEDITNNEERNELVLDLIKILQNQNNSVLVLGDRIEHLKYLQSEINNSKEIDGKMVSKTQKEERKKALEDMRNGNINVLFASYSLAKEGLDIPNLDRLIFLTPHKDRATILQSLGRIERNIEGKNQPICYDLVDDTPLTEIMFFQRKNIYKNSKHKIYNFNNLKENIKNTYIQQQKEIEEKQVDIDEIL